MSTTVINAIRNGCRSDDVTMRFMTEDVRGADSGDGADSGGSGDSLIEIA
jgi:hypothetical protein